ncbi:MAG: hypothetical protein AAF556_03615 [Pseudomonadota bacterium]
MARPFTSPSNRSERSYPLTPLAKRRALGYPYECSYRPFVVTGGGFLSPHISPWPADQRWVEPLAGRYASLAIGSNRSARQLARKYQGWPDPLALPVWPVRVTGLDVHFAAAIGHYGAIPATPVRATDTVCELMLVWLTSAERERMDESEALGHAYDRFKVPVVTKGLPVPVTAVDIYVHRDGTYPLTGRQSVGMAALPVLGARNANIGRLTQVMMQQRLCGRLAPGTGLEQFIASNIHDPPMRRARAAQLRQRAVPAWSPIITDGAVRHDGAGAGIISGGSGGSGGTVMGENQPIQVVSMV